MWEMPVLHVLNLDVYWKVRWRHQVEMSNYKTQRLGEKTGLEIQIWELSDEIT